MAPVRDASKKRGEGGGRPQKLFGRGEEGWEGELYEEEGGGAGNTSFPSLTTQKNQKYTQRLFFIFAIFKRFFPASFFASWQFNWQMLPSWLCRSGGGGTVATRRACKFPTPPVFYSVFPPPRWRENVGKASTCDEEKKRGARSSFSH